MITSKQWFAAGVASLAVLAGSELLATAQPAKPSVEPFNINSGSTYSDDKTPFSTEYMNLKIMNSPHYRSPTGAGMFVFLPKTATGAGGRMQIVFRDLAVPLQLKCQVGANMDFKISIGANGGSKVFTKTASPLPGSMFPYLVIDMDDLKTPGPVSVAIESDKIAAEDQTWDLIECSVSQRP